jgi:hypothetical protein
MLFSGSRDQLCSSPPVLLWSWVFTMLVYWRLVSCLTPFLWGKVCDLSAGPPLSACCDGLLDCFSISQCRLTLVCSLAQEMSFVDHFLPYFRQRLITGPLSALLPFQPLLTESSCRDQLLALPTFSGVLSASCLPLLRVSFQLLVYRSVFGFVFCRGVSLPKRLCWFVPGVAGGIPHDTWCSPVWHAKCLPSRFGASVWQQQQQQLTCFLSVTWHGEVFHRLGVQSVKLLILLFALFLPSVAPASQQDF